MLSISFAHSFLLCHFNLAIYKVHLTAGTRKWVVFEAQTAMIIPHDNSAMITPYLKDISFTVLGAAVRYCACTSISVILQLERGYSFAKDRVGGFQIY